MAKLNADTVGFRCPVCNQLCNAFDEVIFVENFTAVFNWRHCGKDLTSGEVNILKLLPTRNTEKVN